MGAGDRNLVWVKRWVITLGILNLIDAISTFFALHTHRINEVNPLMRWAYEAHPALFLELKLGLVSWLCWIYWKGETLLGPRLSMFRLIFFGVIGLYATIAVQHAFFWFHYLKDPAYWSILP